MRVGLGQGVRVRVLTAHLGDEIGLLLDLLEMLGVLLALTGKQRQSGDVWGETMGIWGVCLYAYTICRGWRCEGGG